MKISLTFLDVECFFQSGVFQEIVKIEDKYAEKFLKVLGNDCFTPTSEAESLLLLHIQNLRIDSLTDLHVRFQNELLQNRENSMNGTRPNIPDAFVKFKVLLLKFIVTIEIGTNYSNLLFRMTF